MNKIDVLSAVQGIRFLTRTFTSLRTGTEGIVTMEFDSDSQVVVINGNILIPVGVGMQMEMAEPWQKTSPTEAKPGENSSSKSDDLVRVTGKQQKPR